MKISSKTPRVANAILLILTAILIGMHVHRLNREVGVLQSELSGLGPVSEVTEFGARLSQRAATEGIPPVLREWRFLHASLKKNEAAFREVEHQLSLLQGVPAGGELAPVFRALNECNLSLADTSLLILDTNLTRYYLIELLTRSIPEAISHVSITGNPNSAKIDLEVFLHSLSVRGIPKEVESAANHFLNARTENETLDSLGYLTIQVAGAIDTLLQEQLQKSRIEETVTVIIGLIGLLVSLLLNRAMIIRTSAYLDPVGYAVKALRIFCLIILLGNLWAWFILPHEISREPYVLNFSACILAFAISFLRKGKFLLVTSILTLLCVGAVFFGASVTAIQLLEHEIQLQPYLGVKFAVLLIGLLAPPPAALPLFVIFIAGILSPTEYFLLFTPKLRAALPPTEFLSSSLYALISLAIYLFRSRETLTERELLQAVQEKESTQKTVQLRNDFINIAAHELRTPLTPLALQTKIIRRMLFSIRPQGEEKILPMIDSIEKEVNRIQRLAETMLVTSQIDAGELHLHRSDSNINDILERTIGRYRHDLKTARCPLSLEVAPTIRGNWDPDLLDQAIGNLIENAMKYGRGKPIEIRAEKNQGRLEIRVRDHGIGFPTENERDLFSRFYRGVSVESYGGFGLGLYIARHIVTEHGGTIRGKPCSDEGTEFVITLPLAA